MQHLQQKRQRQQQAAAGNYAWGYMPAREAPRPARSAALHQWQQMQPPGQHPAQHLLARPVQEGAPVKAVGAQDCVLHQAGLVPLLPRVKHKAAPPRAPQH
jgi:hypothetical protein